MIARVFPRRTKATPIDDYTFVGLPGLFIPDDVTEVHISVTFTWDLPLVDSMQRAWKRIAPVTIGGPATGQPGEDFIPGMYLKRGYVITSRGCPNHCWFCSVPKREGALRELPIQDGHNVLDDNLLACSDRHIKAVFEMLSVQKEKALFTGGMEAALLKKWHVELFKWVRPKRIFFAYDTPEKLHPLEEAARLFYESGYGTRSTLYSYVLVGYPGDTFEKAEKRLNQVISIGFCPMAMLYRDDKGDTTSDWRKFQRSWARPAAIFAKNRDMRYLPQMEA